MRTFDVEVVKTLTRTITVKAQDEIDARDIVEEMYRGEEIILDDSDLVQINFYSIDYD
jgi:hypothetical protein